MQILSLVDRQTTLINEMFKTPYGYSVYSV